MTVAEHVARQILQKGRLFITGNMLSFREVPWIQSFSAVQIDIDHTATHQIDQRLVRIPTLQNRHQRTGTRHHQQLELREERLASTAFRHDERSEEHTSELQSL